MAYNSVTYQWIFNGTPIVGATSGIYIATHPGNYQVLVSDANGCTAVSLAVAIEVTGINPISDNTGFSIYPNPALSSITVTVPEKFLGSILIITDVTGREMAAVQLQTINNKLETSNLANGIYFLRIYKGGAVLTQKLVVQR